MIFPQKIREETVVDQSGKILRDQQITIKSIFVDSILLDMHIVHDQSEFMPCYRQDFIEYCKHNSVDVDYGPCRTLDLFHAGTWRLNWIEPFWSWYQYQRRQRQKLHHDISKFQNMIGDDHDKIDRDLQSFRQHYFT
jgi:hypothetical protein